jgi:hypothetical protein
MSPEYHGFLKALQVAAAQSVGAHVQSEMPPLPQLPRITVSKHQHPTTTKKWSVITGQYIDI